MKHFFIFSVFLCLIGTAHAQVAGRITQIINTEKVTYGQVSYMAAVATGLAQETDTYEKCYEALINEEIITGNHELKDPVSTKYLADIISRNWNINNSVMYRIFHDKRHALKQLKAIGIIPDNYYPNRTLTGAEMMNILTLCLENFNAKGTY